MGSEMCIRDRPDGDLFGPEGPKITKDYFPDSWQKISRDKVG